MFGLGLYLVDYFRYTQRIKRDKKIRSVFGILQNNKAFKKGIQMKKVFKCFIVRYGNDILRIMKWLAFEWFEGVFKNDERIYITLTITRRKK